LGKAALPTLLLPSGHRSRRTSSNNPRSIMDPVGGIQNSASNYGQIAQNAGRGRNTPTKPTDLRNYSTGANLNQLQPAILAERPSAARSTAVASQEYCRGRRAVRGEMAIRPRHSMSNYPPRL
jgi:hypothetical protein